MKTFLDRLVHYSHWVFFLLLETLSGVLLFQFNHYQGSIWFTQANTVAGVILEWEAKALAYINLVDNNRSLTNENLVLQHQLDALRNELNALKHDSTYTERVQTKLLENTKLIPAHIITNSIAQRDNYITIDCGSKDGIRSEMGVVSGTGIVGITYLVSEHYTIVLPILNSKSSISCRLRGTDYFGYLKWRGGNPLQAYIDDVPRHAKFQVGDIVETSGFSSVFPPGIFVGKVAQIHDSSDGLAYQLEVQLSTDLSKLRDVCVVTQEYKAELDSLETEAHK